MQGAPLGVHTLVYSMGNECDVWWHSQQPHWLRAPCLQTSNFQVLQGCILGNAKEEHSSTPSPPQRRSRSHRGRK